MNDLCDSKYIAYSDTVYPHTGNCRYVNTHDPTGLLLVWYGTIPAVVPTRNNQVPGTQRYLLTAGSSTTTAGTGIP
jgi:hypothetical protein